METKKKKIPAVANDTKGGKSNMSQANPQKPDCAPMGRFKGIEIKGDKYE